MEENILLSDLIIVDLRDPAQFNLLNPIYKDKAKEDLANGRTHIGYDIKSGDIYLAVENGELFFIDPIKTIYHNNAQEYLNFKE